MGPLIRTRLSAALLCAALFFAALAVPTAAWATGLADFPSQPPASHVLDQADLLSRSADAELDRRLQDFGGDRIDARLVTLRRLDYGLSLDALGDQLVQAWGSDASDRSLLLLLIESQNNSAAVVASNDLEGQLSTELLSSTAISTARPVVSSPSTHSSSRLVSLQRRGSIWAPITARSTTCTNWLPS